MHSNEGKAPSKTGVVRDTRYLEHIPGPGHIESPSRLEAIYRRLDQPDAVSLYAVIPPRPATREELAWNHTPDYVERIARTAGKEFVFLDPDTGTSPGSWTAACLAVGGVFALMDAIMREEIPNGLALVRPPGHHAERDHAMGFCLFNNVALGAHYARRVLGLARVLIVDWDLHHGNGTQSSFYRDPSVLYISTHQYPHYPGSGRIEQTGEDEGKGFTINIPLSAGMGDADYSAVFSQIVDPVARAFEPEFILVSAGFDIYAGDPLGGMRVTEEGFAVLARSLLDAARDCCRGRIVFCLEGGYSLKGLADGVRAVLGECSGRRRTGPEISFPPPTAAAMRIIDRVKEAHQGLWPVLR